MLTREEYEKEFIRMMDSKRILFKKHNGCDGVICPNCPLNSECHNTPVNPFNLIAIVEQWSKDHPIITNADKFKEVFGIDPDYSMCPLLIKNCDYCKRQKECDAADHVFWDLEYKNPEEIQIIKRQLNEKFGYTDTDSVKCNKEDQQ